MIEPPAPLPVPAEPWSVQFAPAWFGVVLDAQDWTEIVCAVGAVARVVSAAPSWRVAAAARRRNVSIVPLPLSVLHQPSGIDDAMPTPLAYVMAKRWNVPACTKPWCPVVSSLKMPDVESPEKARARVPPPAADAPIIAFENVCVALHVCAIPSPANVVVVAGRERVTVPRAPVTG